MTLEGANNAMKRRGGKVKREVSILERLQNIRAMLIEVRETLGDNSPIEYEAPIDAVSELITDVETEAKREVVAVATTFDKPEEKPEEKIKEEAVPEQPRRRGRPRKQVAELEEPQQPAVRRRKAKKSDEHKELFPFYEQSLF